MKRSVRINLLLVLGFCGRNLVADKIQKPPAGLDCTQRSGECGELLRVAVKATVLRETPEVTGRKVVTLTKGNFIWRLGIAKIDQIAGIYSRWYQVIDKNSKSGYIFGAELERVTPYPIGKGQEYRINVGNLKLRRYPNKNAKSIGLLQQGTAVTKLDESLTLDYYIGDFLVSYARIRTSTGKLGWVPIYALSDATYYDIQCLDLKKAWRSFSGGCVGTGCKTCGGTTVTFDGDGSFKIAFSCHGPTIEGQWMRNNSKILAEATDEQDQTQDCIHECALHEGPIASDVERNECRAKCAQRSSEFYGREIYKAKYEYEFSPAPNNSIKMTLKSTDLNRVKGKAEYLLHQSVKDQDIGCMQPLRTNEK